MSVDLIGGVLDSVPPKGAAVPMLVIVSPDSVGAHVLLAHFGAGRSDLVWDGGGFCSPYAASRRSPAPNGWRYEVRRPSGWSSIPTFEARDASTLIGGDRVQLFPQATAEQTTQMFEQVATAGGKYMVQPGGVYKFTRGIRYALLGRLDIWCPDEMNPAIFEADASWAPAVGSGDDRDVAFFRIEMQTTDTISTTLNGAHAADTRRIKVAAGGGNATDGLWLRIRGAISGSVVFEEIVKASGPGTADGVPLYSALAQPHVTGVEVKSCLVPENIRFQNILFRTSANPLAPGNHACAIAMRNVHRIFLEGLSFQGFARAGIDLKGCRSEFIGRLHDLGSNNSLVILDSVPIGKCGDGNWTYDDTAPRFHPTAGLRRGKVRVWQGSSQQVIDPGIVGRGVKAVEVTAQYGALVKSFGAFDFRADFTNDTEWGGTYIGSAFDGDPHNAAFNAFGYGLHLEGYLAVNHRTAVTADVILNAPVVCDLRDQLHMNAGLLTHLVTAYPTAGNPAFVPTGATVNGDSDYQSRGVAIYDSSGNIGGVVEDGSDWPLETGGSFAMVNLPSWYGNGTLLLKRSMSFSHAALHQGPRIGSAILEDVFIGPMFETGFADWGLRIGNLLYNGAPFSDAIATSWVGASPASGFGVQADGAAAAGVRKAKAAALNDVAPWVVVSPNFGGSVAGIFASALPGVLNTVRVNAAAGPGAFISAADAAGNFAVGAGPTFDQSGGRISVAIGGAGLTTAGA